MAPEDVSNEVIVLISEEFKAFVDFLLSLNAVNKFCSGSGVVTRFKGMYFSGGEGCVKIDDEGLAGLCSLGTNLGNTDWSGKLASDMRWWIRLKTLLTTRLQ